MKRKAMRGALLICAFGGMLFLASGVSAQAPLPATNTAPSVMQNPYWMPQQFLQTNWWTSLTAYHPLFWLLFNWVGSAPAEADWNTGPNMGPRTLPRVCGGEEGFIMFIRG